MQQNAARGLEPCSPSHFAVSDVAYGCVNRKTERTQVAEKLGTGERYFDEVPNQSDLLIKASHVTVRIFCCGRLDAFRWRLLWNGKVSGVGGP